MGATVAESAAADRLLTEAVGLVDRSERGKLALTGPQAKELLSGPGHQRHRGAAPGTGCYAALLTNKGKMLADLRVLDTGAELLARHRARGAAGAVRLAAPRRGRLGRRAAQAHARAGAAVARRARRRARPPAPRSAPSTPTARAARRRRRAARRHRPRGRRRLRRRGRRPRPRRARGPRGARGRGAEVLRVESRAPALRRRPRRRDDPPGGRPQRSRRELHEGLLRRPGDRRAAALPGQAQPPPARAAAVGPRGVGDTAGARRARGRPLWARPSSPPASARSPSRWSAARRRRRRLVARRRPARSSPSCRSGRIARAAVSRR